MRRPDDWYELQRVLPIISRELDRIAKEQDEGGRCEDSDCGFELLRELEEEPWPAVFRRWPWWQRYLWYVTHDY